MEGDSFKTSQEIEGRQSPRLRGQDAMALCVIWFGRPLPCEVASEQVWRQSDASVSCSWERCLSAWLIRQPNRIHEYKFNNYRLYGQFRLVLLEFGKYIEPIRRDRDRQTDGQRQREKKQRFWNRQMTSKSTRRRHSQTEEERLSVCEKRNEKFDYSIEKEIFSSD